MTVLTLNKVTKRFGDVHALDGVSFEVKRGEVVGFVGANGAGKTTTISTILGFISATEGEVKVFGEVVTPGTAHTLHGRIGYAAGDMELPPKLTGRQFLRFVAAQFGGSHDSRLVELTKRFKPVLDKKIGTLSRGNKQKIALIAAFMTTPKLVVLDEPTSGLDPVMQEVFLDLVREVQAAGTTVFMSSHYLNEVADVCSRVILMQGGRVVRDMATAEMVADSGKRIRVLTGYKATKPPAGAADVVKMAEGDMLAVSFIYRGKMSELQVWVAGLKQLQDIEIAEHNLEGVFASLYESEGGAK